MTADRDPLRLIFDEAADLYDRVRPWYPTALFDDLQGLACVGSGCRVLEIGPGTGRATVPLAALGSDLVAVEIGASLAAVARRNVQHFPNASVDVADFETWPLPDEPFDTVVSATAFHWIDPDIRLAKAARALRPGGALAVIATHHVRGGSVDFFDEAQRCYESWDPATPPGLQAIDPGDIAPGSAELMVDGTFSGGTDRRYEADIEYTARGYADVLMTYSGHRALREEPRTGLVACIEQLITMRYGGAVTKRYLFELSVAYRA